MDTREPRSCPICGKRPRDSAAEIAYINALREALASQAAEIARLREENARLDHAASSMSAGLFRVTADNERATAEVGRLREALGNALTWHEDQDEGLSKQPPSHGPNGNQWARLQHREQMQEIRAVLDGEKP